MVDVVMVFTIVRPLGGNSRNILASSPRELVRNFDEDSDSDADLEPLVSPREVIDLFEAALKQSGWTNDKVRVTPSLLTRI